MILHHSSGKTRLLKRIFSMCIALLMVCTFSNPAFATDQAITETAVPPEITYNFYSGGELYGSQTVKDGETLTEPTVPTVAGTIFEGWLSSEDETAQKFEAFGTVSVTEKANVDLYAKHQAITETAPLLEITYNFYSGGELYSSQTVKDGEILTEPTAPTVEGKIFEGWFTTEDETAQKFEAFGTVSVTEKAVVDLYAKWTELPANVADEPDSTADAVNSADGVNPADEVNPTDEVNSDDGVMPASINENTGTDYSEVKAAEMKVGEERTFYAPSGSREQSWSFTNVNGQGATNCLAPKEYGTQDRRSYITVQALQAGTYTLKYGNRNDNQVLITVISDTTKPAIQFVNVYAEVPPSTSQYGGIYVAYTYSGGDSQMKIRFEDEEGKLLTDEDNAYFGGQYYDFSTNSVNLSLSTFASSVPAGYTYVGAFFYWSDHLSEDGKLVSYSDNSINKVYVTSVEKKNTHGRFSSYLWYSGQYVPKDNQSGSNNGSWEYQPTGVLHVVYMKESSGKSITIKDHDDKNLAQTSGLMKDHDDGSQYVDLLSSWVDGIPTPHTEPGATYQFKGWKIIEGNEKGDTLYSADELKAYLKDTKRFKLTENTVIKATCELSTVDLSVTKEIKGRMGDKSKAFSFICSYTKDGKHKEETFGLSDNETFSIKNVPIGIELTITETNAEGYITTAKYSGVNAGNITGDKVDACKIIKITVEAGKQEIVVTNTKDAIPDTGVNLTTLPYVLILAFVAGGSAVLVVCKKRSIRKREGQ